MQADDRFKEVQRVFDAALQHDEEERKRFVEDACGEDRAMAEEILALLRYDAQRADVETVRPLALAAEAFEAAEVGSLIGQTVGRFRLEAEIASGGMGRVFKARRIDGDVEQIVALKLIRRELFNDALLKRFSDERRILASLSHPGIAHLIDAGTDAHGAPFVAMEYVDGLPLMEYCARHRLSIRERLMLFRQILAAVAHAHRNLVVHRDLKPDNVLVTADGHAKLLDFGIAKALALDEQQTQTAQRFFTPAYAAPEQIAGDNVAVACDVYGLGAILYALLTGVAPFDLSSSSAGEIERMILKTPPLPLRTAAQKRGAEVLAVQGVSNPSRWAAQLDGDLDNIVQKALRKEPDARYAGVDAFDEDIQRFTTQRPVAATGAGWMYRTRKFCERNAAALVFVAVLLGAGAVAVMQNMRQNDLIRQQRDDIQFAWDMLGNAFLSADPAAESAYLLGGESDNIGLQSSDPRARTILAAFVRDIAKIEKKQPDRFREVAYQTGRIQLNLGMTRDGLDLIRRANSAIAQPPDVGLLLELRGTVMASELKEARRMIKQHRSRLGSDPGFVAEEARLLYLEDRYQEAVIKLEALLSGAYGTLHPEVSERIHLYLAEAYRLSDDLRRSLGVLDRQIADHRKRFGANHPRTVVLRLRRVELLTKIEDAASAERELIAIKPVLDRYYDQGSAVQAQYHNIYGQFLNARERSEEALDQFRRALRANQIALGPDHENTLRSHLNVATVISYSQDDRSAAYSHFEQAIAGIEKTKGLAYSLVGFARLEAAKTHYWDAATKPQERAKYFAAAKSVMTPEHAPQFFPQMPDINRKEYLAGLYFGFGPQDCAPGWERQSANQPQPQRIARTLMCRYDPKGEIRPVD
jgi:eukaryotic-like serine/threonine-protein kinase